MCIMEVRPGQRDSTIAQAMYHNTSTVVGDLTMWRTLLVERARHESGDMRLDTEASIAQVDRALSMLEHGAAGLLGLFGAEVGRHVEHWRANGSAGHAPMVGAAHGPDRGYSTSLATGQPIIGPSRLIVPTMPGEPVGLVQVAAEDAKRARKFETR